MQITKMTEDIKKEPKDEFEGKTLCTSLEISANTIADKVEQFLKENCAPSLADEKKIEEDLDSPLQLNGREIVINGVNMHVSVQPMENQTEWFSNVAKAIINEKLTMRILKKVDKIIADVTNNNNNAGDLNLLVPNTEEPKVSQLPKMEAEQPKIELFVTPNADPVCQREATQIQAPEFPITTVTESDLQELIDYELSKKKLKTENKIETETAERIVEVKNEEVTVAPKKEAIPFVSTDVAENSDNFNVGWAPLRDAPTDVERYRLIRQRWRNLTVPDPSKNLSFRHAGQCHYPAEKREPAGKTTRRIRTMSCTSIYEIMVNNLKNEKKSAKRNLINKHINQKNNLRKKQEDYLKYIKNIVGFSTFFHPILNVISDQQHMEIEDLMDSHAYELEKMTSNTENDIKKLNDYMKEVRSFHQFYQGLDSSFPADKTILTEEQIEFEEEVDKMYEAYKQYYR